MDQTVPITTSIVAFVVALAVFVYIICRRCRSPKRERHIRARRPTDRPMISPLAHSEWETQGTFNPAAITDDEGRVHILYRAIGNDGISRIGYASSGDGVRVDGRSSYPVFAMSVPDRELQPGTRRYDPIMYASGGSWGGTEDPRMVRIGDRVYMTLTAFEDWGNMRIALTSIALEDMKKRQWKWRRPVFISPKNARSKNWVIFPEKVNGKYAILHGISPNILIAYTDSLDIIPAFASSPDHGGYGYHDRSREKYWDSTVKGAGAPPLKTKDGWLLLYHAIHENRYKVGAMLLDLHDPTKVLYRSPAPILFPEMPYENDGKPNIVYATGAVVKGDDLYIYYGGGDKHVCVAQMNLDELLGWLKKYGKN